MLYIESTWEEGLRKEVWVGVRFNFPGYIMSTFFSNPEET